MSKAWFDVHWLDTVRPGSAWPLTVEKLLIVLQQLAPSWKDERWHRRDRWTTRTPNDLLSADNGRWDVIGVAPICSVDDLRRRFQYIVLARCGSAKTDPVQAWRDHWGIRLDGKRRVRAQHGGLGWDDAIKSFLGFKAALLQVSLNYIHRRAREFKGTEITIGHGGLCSFQVNIGLDGSRWTEIITRQRPGEPVGETAVRALAMLRALAGRGDAPFVEERFRDDSPFVVYVDEQGPLTSENRAHGDGWRVISEHATRPEAEDAAMALIAAGAPWPAPKEREMKEPVELILYCPGCGWRHWDLGDTKCAPHNQPHTVHTCVRCGETWQPAEVPTSGIFTMTGHRRGESPSPPPRMQTYLRAPKIPTEPGTWLLVDEDGIGEFEAVDVLRDRQFEESHHRSLYVLGEHGERVPVVNYPRARQWAGKLKAP